MRLHSTFNNECISWNVFQKSVPRRASLFLSALKRDALIQDMSRGPYHQRAISFLVNMLLMLIDRLGIVY